MRVRTGGETKKFENFLSLTVSYFSISLHRRGGRGARGLLFMQSRVPLGPDKFHVVVLVLQKGDRLFPKYNMLYVSDSLLGGPPIGFFNPAIPTRIFPQSRNPDGFYPLTSCVTESFLWSFIAHFFFFFPFFCFASLILFDNACLSDHFQSIPEKRVSRR